MLNLKKTEFVNFQKTNLIIKKINTIMFNHRRNIKINNNTSQIHYIKQIIYIYEI